MDRFPLRQGIRVEGEGRGRKENMLSRKGIGVKRGEWRGAERSDGRGSGFAYEKKCCIFLIKENIKKMKNKKCNFIIFSTYSFSHCF